MKAPLEDPIALDPLRGVIIIERWLTMLQSASASDGRASDGQIDMLLQAVRSAIFGVMVFMAGCAHPDAGVFQLGQIWTLNVPDAPNARLVIGRVEQRQGHTVIHGSVLDLPAPARGAEALERMVRYFSPDEPDRAPPERFIVAGYGLGDDLDIGIAELDLSSPEQARVTIPHLAIHERDARSAVGELVVGRREPVELFEDYYRMWREQDARWPDLVARQLDRPLMRRIEAARNGLAFQVNEFLVPAPPAGPAVGEYVVHDPAFEAHCRTQAATILGQFGEEIGPSILTRSEAFGLTWRADRLKSGSAGATVNRIMCWARDEEERTHIAYAWRVAPLAQATSAPSSDNPR